MVVGRATIISFLSTEISYISFFVEFLIFREKSLLAAKPIELNNFQIFVQLLFFFICAKTNSKKNIFLREKIFKKVNKFFLKLKQEKKSFFMLFYERYHVFGFKKGSKNVKIMRSELQIPRLTPPILILFSKPGTFQKNTLFLVYFCLDIVFSFLVKNNNKFSGKLFRVTS